MSQKIDTIKLRGQLFTNQSMISFSSWRAGGKVKNLYIPADLDDLVMFLSLLSDDEPLIWLGAGTNILVKDSGWSGTIIYLRNSLNEINLIDENMFHVGAGTMSANLSHKTADLGFHGLEFLCGIPGTVGGALAMNAGAEGASIWDYVKKVETIDRSGDHNIRDPDEFIIEYRSVKKPRDEWFLNAVFDLPKGETETAKEKIKGLLSKRKSSQPLSLPSAGSVFRNPEGDFSARLIELSGLKGLRIGGAAISEKHANFIVNMGEAKASEIEELINHIIFKVERDHQIKLVLEIHIIGD